MRKLKVLMAACALVGSAVATWAQTDVTSTYLTADFSSATGWTSFSGGGTEHSEGFGLIGTLSLNGKSSTTDATHLSSEYCCGLSARWNGRYTYYQQTTKSLPMGYWTVKYDVQDVNTTSTKYNMDNHFYVKVGETKYSDSSTEWMNAGASSWTAHSISFVLNEESTVTLSFGYGNKENKGTSDCPAIYVSHLKLEYTPFATAEDYANLNSAISTVEGKPWGFDEGEYAPYDYAEVLQALAEAKAIDQEANNSQPTVQNLTSIMNNAVWTANASEVNAIWDGSFEHDYSGLTGNVQPIGWYRVKGTSDDGYNVRYASTDNFAGVAYTSSDHGLFTKLNAYYGWGNGYTMPLNEDTYYTISFVTGGAGDCPDLTCNIDIINPSEETTRIKTYAVQNTTANSDATSSSWSTIQQIFKTDDAGNYVLGLVPRNSGNKVQNQFIYGDFVLKTTTVADATAYYNAVKDEVDDSYDAGANGGSEKTAFKTAIDASAPATVAEIMVAAAELYTLRDAFVAATPKYDALETERASAIALGVSSSSANAVTMTLASQLQEKLQELYVLEDAAVTSGYVVDATTKFGSWTPQNLDTKNTEHWSGNAVTFYDRWQNSGFTSSITSTVTLPAGKYVFKLAARAAQNGINGAFNMSVKVGDNAAVYKDFVAKNGSGKGITTSGAVSYSEGEFCNNGNGYGWEWRFIAFELDDEAEVTLKGYAQVYANNWVGFSDATLLTTSDNVAVLKDLLNAEITTARGIDTETNVGDGVFQIPSSAVTALGDAIGSAQGVYDDGDATSTEVSEAISSLQTAETTYKNTVNPPAVGKKYYIKVATTGHAKLNKAWLLAAGSTSANNPTGYTIAATNDPAAYFSQAFTFTQVSGNTYNISITLPEGEVYLTYGSLNGSAAGWNKQQIQATTNSENKGEFKIYAGNVANTFKIFNIVDNNYIDSQDGGNIYTDTSIEKELFAVDEASQATVNVNIPETVKYGTRIFPFTPTLPDGVTAYSCEASSGDVLTLVAVDEPQANIPYILEALEGCASTDLEGWGTASTDAYTTGWLTGVYTSREAINGTYVLQNNGGKVGFYKVDTSDVIPTVGAYRCYLSVPSGVRPAFFFGDETTGIDAINGLTSGSATIYSVDGRHLPSLQKGLNIVKTNGKTYKVMVK